MHATISCSYAHPLNLINSCSPRLTDMYTFTNISPPPAIDNVLMLDYQRFNYISACCKQKLQISCNSDSYSICNNILKINAF